MWSGFIWLRTGRYRHSDVTSYLIGTSEFLNTSVASRFRQAPLRQAV